MTAKILFYILSYRMNFGGGAVMDENIYEKNCKNHENATKKFHQLVS